MFLLVLVYVFVLSFSPMHLSHKRKTLTRPLTSDGNFDWQLCFNGFRYLICHLLNRFAFCFSLVFFLFSFSTTMTDRQPDTGVRELYPVPPWARDPRKYLAAYKDEKDTSFGVYVQSLVPGHKDDVAPLGQNLSNNIEEALNGHPGEDGFCPVRAVSQGDLGEGFEFQVSPKRNILLDVKTGHEYKLHRYIPQWARDPRKFAAAFKSKEVYEKNGERVVVENESFGVYVKPLVPGHKDDVAPLGQNLSNNIEKALNSHPGEDGFCPVRDVPRGLGQGFEFKVSPKRNILLDVKAGREYKLHRYIPRWARDPRQYFYNEGNPVCCVDIHPLEPGHEYEVAPLKSTVSNDVEKKLKSEGHFEDFLDLDEFQDDRGVSCHLAVQRGTGVLRDKDTGEEYRLSLYTPQFHVHSLPEWAETQKQFFASERGKSVEGFVGIKVKVDGHEEVAHPKVLNERDLIEKMKEHPQEGSWVDVSQGGVGLEMNRFKSLLRETSGDKRVYKLVYQITQKALSDPYDCGDGGLSSTDTFSFQLPGDKTQEEKVTVSPIKKRVSGVDATSPEFVTVDFRTCVRHCYSRVLSKSNEGLEEVYCNPAESEERSKKESGGHMVSHGQFVWVYEDPPQTNYPGAVLKAYTATVFNESISDGLEKAMKEGKSSYSFNLSHVGGPDVEYEVDISTDRMLQKQKDSPFHARRVWRIGTPFKKSLCECWKLLHMLSDVPEDVPTYWDNEGQSPFVVGMKSPEGQHVLEVIQKSISEYEKHPHPMTGIGSNWGNMEEVVQTDAGNPVHHVEKIGDEKVVIREKPSAVHVVAILRLQNRPRFLDYRRYQNRVLSVQGSNLPNEPESRYLEDTPMATGPANDSRVNEVWGFNGTSVKVACDLIKNEIFTNARAAGDGNIFGRALYFADSFVKAIKYCGCPICRNGQRGANGVANECTCEDRNLTHPRIVFLTRLTLGRPLIIRDASQYMMHDDDEDDAKFPTIDFNAKYPATIWYDSGSKGAAEWCKDEEDSARKSMLPNSVVLPIVNLHGDGDWKMIPKPWFFFVKNANASTPGYKMFLEKLVTGGSGIRDCVNKLPFGVIIDENASDDAVALAMLLRARLAALGACECFYTPRGWTVEDIIEGHQGESDLREMFPKGPEEEESEEQPAQMTGDPPQESNPKPPRKVRRVPGRDVSVVIPDMEKPIEHDSNGAQARANTVLVEDVLHTDPSMLLKHRVAYPSMFYERQLKHREMVMFETKAIYSEYAIVFYEYESKEAMMENFPLEYPQNRHGRGADAPPHYFLFRDTSVVPESHHDDHAQDGSGETGTSDASKHVHESSGSPRSDTEGHDIPGPDVVDGSLACPEMTPQNGFFTFNHF